MELHLQLSDTYLVLKKEELYKITWHLSNTVQLRSSFTIQVTTALNKLGDMIFSCMV